MHGETLSHTMSDALVILGAAGLVIRHAGTAVTTREELLAALSAEPLAPAEA